MPDDRMAQARKQAERPLSPIRAAAMAGLPELLEIQCKQRCPSMQRTPMRALDGFDRNRER